MSLPTEHCQQYLHKETQQKETAIMADEESTGTTSLMERLLAQQTQVEETITGDIISTGAQIRLNVNGEPNFTPLDGIQTFIALDVLHITRWTRRTQNDMVVISATLTTKGERIGVSPDGKELVLLPAYVLPQFATWGTWVHLMNVEFMNVNVEEAKKVEAFLVDNGFVQYTPRNLPGQPERERTSEIHFDMEAPGRSLMDRHPNGVPLKSATLLPDIRVSPMRTEYTKSGETEPTPRAGFTGFVDSLMMGVDDVIEASLLGEDVEDRAEKQRDANSRLSVLTGTDKETGYSVRPTLGYLTFDGINPETKEPWEEISLFPPRNETTEATGEDGETIEEEEPFDA